MNFFGPYIRGKVGSRFDRSKAVDGPIFVKNKADLAAQALYG